MKRLARWVVCLGLFACCLDCAAPTRAARRPNPEAPTLRVMTYNLNYGLAGDEETLAAVAAGGADLVLLQETTPQWEEALRERFARDYPHMAFRHCCGAGGLAVLSRYAFAVRDYGHSSVGWFPALRLVTATPVGQVQVLAVHLRPPLSDDGSWLSGYFSTGPARLAEMKELLARLEPGLPTLVVGDFNEGVGGEAVAELEAQGLRTALAEFHPGAKTWRWRVGPLRLSAQLDHLAYGPGLEPLWVGVVYRGRSDHLPVVGVFERVAKDTARPPPPRGGSLSVGL